MSDFKNSEVRTKMIEALKIDLIGPSEEKEKLDESPLSSYISGILHPNKTLVGEEVEIENLSFTSEGIEENIETSEDEETTNEKINIKFSQQSSIGISFYIPEDVNVLIASVRWGEYVKDRILVPDPKDITGQKQIKKTVYKREQKDEKISIDLRKESLIGLKENDLIKIKVTPMKLNTGTRLISLYLTNNQESTMERDFSKTMFQVELKIEGVGKEDIFLPEHLCRELEVEDEFYYENKPIFARGHGCASEWSVGEGNKANLIKSTFMPEHEINSVSPFLDGFEEKYFSMRFMSIPKNKNEILDRLNRLCEDYNFWINNLKKSSKMEDNSFVEKGYRIINQCSDAYNRMKKGIKLLESNNEAFQAFCFMNQSMYLQRSISSFAQKHGSGVDCNLTDFTKEDHSEWRPFQLAFILLNMLSCVDQEDEYRDNVDLLYFPTGGGKTEAYLGLMAFVIGYRRLTAKHETEYIKDGGVTIFLRYTLRLLTTQQRDRLTKMICAAEIIREKNPELYGNTKISIGFWVGGGVTPNKFKDFKDTEKEPNKSRKYINMLTKQIIKCPICGTEIKQANYDIDLERCDVKIYCSNKKCYFYKYNDKDIPVYLIDEQIYRKCPTVIISTVDKFAQLPWNEKTGLIFGRTDRYCERHGYMAIGEEHQSKHNQNKKLGIPKANVVKIKPFYPPELIVQDELHLITGPLGTIYGGYETVIEELCSIERNGKKILPKYIVSTATIKNAKEQIKCLYGREKYSQFPPSGFEIADSYFIKEISLMDKPFRRYCGVCATGQSMKTVILRVYAVLLQAAHELSKQDKYKDYVDPYHTLIGYFNSVRELGGTVRLLQDDIPDRINRICKKYGYSSRRYLNRTKEITSRVSSYKIAELLEQLTITNDNKECLDVAIATNMIAVGMDVDRLGLMTVVGQPKQSSEYIQATSRIGRNYPGLVVTIYNPYRPRDISHYENFKGFHSQMYRYVEGTTATPFSARARDRVLHALVVGMLRLTNVELSINKNANDIDSISDKILEEAKNVIMERVVVVAPKAQQDTLSEMNGFIEDWKQLSKEEKYLYYYVVNTEKYNRLLNYYSKPCTSKEKPTLNSMREVESSSSLYYYIEEAH